MKESDEIKKIYVSLFKNTACVVPVRFQTHLFHEMDIFTIERKREIEKLWEREKEVHFVKCEFPNNN